MPLGCITGPDGNMRCEALTHAASRLCPMLATSNTSQRTNTYKGMSRGGGRIYHNMQQTTLHHSSNRGAHQELHLLAAH